VQASTGGSVQYGTVIMRTWLLRRVMADFGAVAHTQRLLGLEKDKPPRLPLLHVSLRIAAALGDEMFYMMALPLLFWVWPGGDAARRLVYVWMLVYYLGHTAKDLLQLPRPPSPPVLQLERHYATEYGLPSTHAMVALALPFSALHMLQDPQLRLSLFPVALLWTGLISLSRLYLGVHSFTDVYAGLLLGVAITCFHVLAGVSIDAFVLARPDFPVVASASLVLLLYLYPAPKKWTNAYGDTTAILAAGIGILVGNWTLVREGKHVLEWSLSTDVAIKLLCRACLGYLIIFVTRALVKFVCLTSLRVSSHELKQYSKEIPVKILVYGFVGFNLSYTAIKIFEFLGI